MEEHAGFLPVEIIDVEGPHREPEVDAPAHAGRIELELAGGHRLQIVGSYDPELPRAVGPVPVPIGSSPRASPTCGAASPRSPRRFELDPYGGIFRGRRGDLIKVIWFDGQGSCLFSKRLERGRFVWPAATEGKVALAPAEMAMLRGHRLAAAGPYVEAAEGGIKTPHQTVGAWGLRRAMIGHARRGQRSPKTPVT